MPQSSYCTKARRGRRRLTNSVSSVGIGFESEEDWFEYRLENDPQICVVSNGHVRACAQGVGSGWKIFETE